MIYKSNCSLPATYVFLLFMPFIQAHNKLLFGISWKNSQYLFYFSTKNAIIFLQFLSY